MVMLPSCLVQSNSHPALNGDPVYKESHPQAYKTHQLLSWFQKMQPGPQFHKIGLPDVFAALTNLTDMVYLKH